MRNTTYKGIYPEESFLSVNSRNYETQKFYEAMGGVVTNKDELQIKYKYVL